VTVCASAQRGACVGRTALGRAGRSRTERVALADAPRATDG
jgi:hypothetical protein